MFEQAGYARLDLAVVSFFVWNACERDAEDWLLYGIERWLQNRGGFLMFYSDRDAVGTQGKWPLIRGGR